MAARKRTNTGTTRRRRRTTSSRTRTSPKSTRRRRTTRRKKGFLSELVPKPVATGTFKATAGGMGGGAAAALLDTLLYKSGKQGSDISRFGTLSMATLVSGLLFRQPYLAAGMAGYTAGAGLKALGLGAQEEMSEDYQYALMENLPAALDADGNPTALSDGSEMYLQEGDDMYLQEGYTYEDMLAQSYEPAYLPQY